MRAQERLRPRTIFFPALPEPRPHGPLNPELLVIEESFEDLERLPPFSRGHGGGHGGDCDPASPKVLWFCPPEEVPPPLGPPPRDRGRRSRSHALSEMPP